MSGCSRPIPAQKSLRPPPDPVDSMTGALKSVFFANLSATIVANGNTVEDPTIDIWFPSLAVVEVISVRAVSYTHLRAHET